MKRFIISITTIITILFLFGCKKEVAKSDEFFYIKTGNSVIPVWITGNTKSNTFIVVIHGGPGAFNSLFDRSPAFKTLKQKYAIAYFDQAGTVNDQGTAGIEDVSEEVFADQTNAVVDYVKQHYEQSTIFLLGHSNGGAIGTAYLLDATRQSKINGWIEVDGAHIKLQSPITFNMSKQFVVNYATEQLSNTSLSAKDRALWEKGLSFENSMTEITKENQREHTEWVRRAKGYYHDPKFELQFADIMDLIFNSKNDMPAVTPNQIQAINAPNQINPLYIDYTPEMYKIKIPSLILSGRYDGILPVGLVPYAINALGTADADKQSFIFEKSAHNPFDEEPDLFVEQVSSFIDRYK